MKLKKIKDTKEDKFWTMNVNISYAIKISQKVFFAIKMPQHSNIMQR